MRGKRRKRRAAHVWKVGVSWLKGELYTQLRAKVPLDKEDPVPAGWCHWPDSYPQEYFKQLTAEHLVTQKDLRGFPKRIWKKTRERNEALDVRVYARAAAVVVGIDRWEQKGTWDKEAPLSKAPARTKSADRTGRKPGFVGGGEPKWRRRGQ